MAGSRAKEMITRIIVALILLPLTLLLIIKGHPHLFFTVILVLVLLATKEMINIMRKDSIKLYDKLMWVTAVIVPTLICFIGLDIFVLISFVTLFLLFILKMFSKNPTENVLEEVSYNFFALMYVPFLFTFFPLLMFENYQYILYLCFVIWASDSFAYFTGVAIGKHKMIPKVSPGKTIEGVTGGIVGALIVAFVFNYYVLNATMLFTTVSAIAIIIAGILGDLMESMMKRSANVKDSGSLLPGHGGILDRFDSLMIGAPVLYFLIQYM